MGHQLFIVFASSCEKASQLLVHVSENAEAEVHLCLEVLLLNFEPLTCIMCLDLMDEDIRVMKNTDDCFPSVSYPFYFYFLI